MYPCTLCRRGHQYSGEDLNFPRPFNAKRVPSVFDFPSKAGAYSLLVRKGYRHARGVA